MSKRPPIDLMSLTSDTAEPMPEAVQRKAATSQAAPILPAEGDELRGLNFKVPQVFRKRFRQRAAAADLQLNELLFAALDAWEREQGGKS
jgi:hypothetical protein